MAKKKSAKINVSALNINVTQAKSASKPKKLSQAELNKMLVENFVSLQKVMTDMAVKFDSLSGQMSRLLNLFEVSAKTFVDKQGTVITKEDKEFVEKLDKLLDQNKTIAKGLTMMEERIREKTGMAQGIPRQEDNSQIRKPLTRF